MVVGFRAWGRFAVFSIALRGLLGQGLNVQSSGPVQAAHDMFG